ncbi:hypothetical protein [Pacificoceanicola onchidii]|uniref:hypothetical protein n=1 Tax=Pacificoceanicola onchidii TaxID=2562685 RepID=UPI0010A565BC|nr:hypothetical protein [Pacificoceanicola onchidii]
MRKFSTAAAFLFLATPLTAQNLINTNTTIHNRLCIGADCATTENYGSDPVTLRLNSLKPGIDFIDASSDPGFPNNDWRIEINDDAATDLSFFRIRDVSSDIVPFQIEAGASPAALYVDDSGNVGFGTTLPEATLDIRGGTNPTIRLEGFYTSGLAVLDMEANVRLIKDDGNNVNGVLEISRAGTANSAPVRFELSAPPDAFVVDHSGNIGMGTKDLDSATALTIEKSGAARIHLLDTSSVSAPREMFKMENNGGSYFTLANTATSNEWYFVHENNTQGRFFVNHSDGGIQMGLTKDGNMTLMGELFTAGSCAAGCDRVFDEDYPLPSIPEQAAMMRALKHLPNVGPTPEDGPFNITKMTGGMLNELEKAHLYIVELEARVAQLEADRRALAELRQRVDALLAD